MSTFFSNLSSSPVFHITLLVIVVVLLWYLIRYLTKNSSTSPTFAPLIPATTNFSTSRITSPNVLNATDYHSLASMTPSDFNCPQWTCPRCPDEEASFMASSPNSLYCPTPPVCPPIQDGIGISCECGSCSTSRNGTIDGGTMIGANSTQTLATETNIGAQSGIMSTNTDLSSTLTYNIPSVMTPSTNTLSTTSNSPTIMRNSTNFQCLQFVTDENGGSTRLQTCATPSASNQQWYMDPNNHIRNSGTSDALGRNRCLDVNLGLPGGTGKPVDMNTCGDGISDNYMQWSVNSNGTITSLADGRCLNYNDSIQKITVEDCPTTIPQSMIWTFV